MAGTVNRAPRASWCIALCGVLGAVSVALMLLGAVIPLAMFIAPAVGGILVQLACEECGRRYAWTLYAAISLLGVLLVPDKEIPLVFLTILGYYPLVKPYIDGLPAAVLRLGAKTVLFAAAIGGMYGVLLLLFPADYAPGALVTAGLWMAAATAGMGYFAFLLFDRALVNLLRLYRLVWQPKLRHLLGR